MDGFLKKAKSIFKFLVTSLRAACLLVGLSKREMLKITQKNSSVLLLLRRRLRSSSSPEYDDGISGRLVKNEIFGILCLSTVCLTLQPPKSKKTQKNSIFFPFLRKLS